MFYLFLRERASMCTQAGQEQREGDRGFKVGSALTAASPMWGLNSQTARLWPERRSDAQPTELPRCPCFFFTPFLNVSCD